MCVYVYVLFILSRVPEREGHKCECGAEFLGHKITMITHPDMVIETKADVQAFTSDNMMMRRGIQRLEERYKELEGRHNDLQAEIDALRDALRDDAFAWLLLQVQLSQEAPAPVRDVPMNNGDVHMNGNGNNNRNKEID